MSKKKKFDALKIHDFRGRFNPVINRKSGERLKETLKKSEKFQKRKNTPPDPIDGHIHVAALDERGTGGTDLAGNPPHAHQIFNFYIEPYYTYDPDNGNSYTSVHPGSLAYGEVKEIKEMEIFRVGTHNGDDFTEDDLEEIAENFQKLKKEVRPKLKITHHGDDKDQAELAGLASYGDITDVYVRDDGNGEKRLYADLVNVPAEVVKWIEDGRFAERSIEIYPQFRLGTNGGSPTYNNVLKAIALLGHEMPAVTGMEPIKLSEFFESQKTICFKGVCLPCEDWRGMSNAIMLFEQQLKMEGR